MKWPWGMSFERRHARKLEGEWRAEVERRLAILETATGVIKARAELKLQQRRAS